MPRSLAHIFRTACSLLSGLFLVLAVACTPSLPPGIMSESHLEDILYDYSLALSMAEHTEVPEGLDREALRYQYVQSVFLHHGVTEAEFDSSMVWYSSEGKRLQAVFQRLNDRLDAEAKTLGVGLSESEVYASYTADGDTANVWNGARIVYLSNQQPDNVMVITLPTDSTYLPGDTYKLSFNANFIPMEGNHNVYAIFSAYYADSSVVSQNQLVSGNHHCELNVKPKPSQDSLQLDRLVVTLYYPPAVAGGTNEYFFMTYPSVLRMHKPKAVEEQAPQDEMMPLDTLSSDSVRLQPDTLGRRLSPLEERDMREQRHDIKIVKERVTRPVRPARTQRRR